MAARSLDAYLNSAGELRHLAAHAEQLVKLQRVFERIAPSHLAVSSRVANFRPGKIVLHADSGAVASKLRQLTARLIDGFSLVGGEITEIRIKVQVGPGVLQAAPPPPRRDSAGLSAVSRNALQALAQSLPEGAALHRALQQLIDDSR